MLLHAKQISPLANNAPGALANFSTYRKKLGLYSFKLKKKGAKNPHAVHINLRAKLLKRGYKGTLKLKDIELNSRRPFGKFTRKGRFIFDPLKVPFYNIPSLDNFELKPYVPYSTPRILDENKVERKVSLDTELFSQIITELRFQGYDPQELNELEHFYHTEYLIQQQKEKIKFMKESHIFKKRAPSKEKAIAIK